MEKRKGRGPYLICCLALVACMVLFTLRLVDWQVINADKWLEAADYSAQGTVRVTAARGEILDRNGKSLAVNDTGYAIVFDSLYMDRDSRNTTILTLVELLNKNKEPWEDMLPVALSSTEGQQYEFLPDSEAEITRLKSKDYADLNDYATADQCITALSDKYGVEGYTPAQTRNLVSVRYGMSRKGFSMSSPYTFAQDVSMGTVSIVRENADKLPGVTVEMTTTRQYPQPALLPQILGSIGALSEDEYNDNKEKGYAYNDRIGKGGVEKAFEETLRGQNGEKLVQTSDMGDPLDEQYVTPPIQGGTVYLTLDSNMQAVGNASLGNNIEATRKNGEALVKTKREDGYGEDCYIGAAVVLDVKTGGVLAAPTWPSYDQSKTSEVEYYNTLLKDPNKPLLNHAFGGAFAPGSCFKPAVALGALEEGVITSSSQITCIGKYTRYQDYQPKCLGVHGSTALEYALMRSCNVYFFETGYRLGIDSMDLYAKQLGLGIKTGVEVGESAGTLAGPKNSTAHGQTWNPAAGTIQAAIGQGDNSFTPLQLAAYAATIANDGKRMTTHVENKITDYTRKNILHEYEPQVAEELSVSQENIKAVQEGMRQVVANSKGTAYRVLGNYPIPVAGKTGTAEWGANRGSDNVTFVGYAPYDDPQIAFSVVLEHGATGTYCQQVVKDLLDAYFFGKTVDAAGNFTIPGTDKGTSSSGASSGDSSGVPLSEQDQVSSAAGTP